MAGMAAAVLNFAVSMPFAATAAPNVLSPNTIADIAQAVSPAVVNIEVDQEVSQPSMVPFLQFPDNPFGNGLDFFFNGQRIQPRGGPHPEMPKMERHNSGSGFIVRQDGYILTNSHVVKGASKITVTLTDKRVFTDAKVVGTDTFYDLAVVKINATNLPIAKLGTSAGLRPGEFAIAIGNPLGFDHTVTFGIISAVGRSVDAVSRDVKLIQTDAAINPGNSGGPLLNLDGDVIGVNIAIQANAQNIGFAIPIDVVKSIEDDLINGRHIARAWLGIMMEDANDVHAKSLGLPAPLKGVFVTKVFRGSSASGAGVQAGDIIQKIDGKDVGTAKEVRELVLAHKVGDTLNLYLLHNKMQKALSVKIGNYPDNPPQAVDDPEE